jgi:GNAT superfamily N-acetyltransferase
VRIESVDVKRASDREYAALNAFMNEIRAERLPEDPPVPLAEEIRRFQTTPTFIDVFTWIAGEGGAVLANATLTVERAGHNTHLVEFGIAVRAGLRRRGIGSQLLERIAGTTGEIGRHLLIAWSQSTIPAGPAFLRRVGARVGLESHMNQLDLRDLDRDLIRRWQERAAERAAGFDLLVWTAGPPEEYVEPFAALIGALNRAPRGTLQVEDFHVTPEQLREWLRTARERGYERWTIVAQERATGRLAGFTEVSWHPNRPKILGQEGTAVMSGFQNLGLGRWLKAAMLEKVLRERPEVEKIRTGNADMNAPMLKINYELGFRPYISHYVWQAELPQVQAYLDSVRPTKLAGVI